MGHERVGGCRDRRDARRVRRGHELDRYRRGLRQGGLRGDRRAGGGGATGPGPRGVEARPGIRGLRIPSGTGPRGMRGLARTPGHRRDRPVPAPLARRDGRSDRGHLGCHGRAPGRRHRAFDRCLELRPGPHRAMRGDPSRGFAPARVLDARLGRPRPDPVVRGARHRRGDVRAARVRLADGHDLARTSHVGDGLAAGRRGRPVHRREARPRPADRRGAAPDRGAPRHLDGAARAGVERRPARCHVGDRRQPERGSHAQTTSRRATSSWTRRRSPRSKGC